MAGMAGMAGMDQLNSVVDGVQQVHITLGLDGSDISSLAIAGIGRHGYGKLACYHQSTCLRASLASPLNAACVLIAFLRSGMATAWLVDTFVCMNDRAVQRQLSWMPQWNAIVFPTALPHV
jgi:hypothetical protein